MSFESLLQSITESEKRSQFSEIASQLPALKKYYELGEQADPAMEHVARVRELTKNSSYDLSKTAKLAADYVTWKGQSWDDEAGMTREEKRAKEMVSDLQNRVAELEQQVGVEMTAEEIKALAEGLLKEKGVLTKDELKTMLPMDRIFDKDGKSILATVPEVDRHVGGIVQRFQDVYAELTPQMVTHHQTFKEPIDMKKVFDTMETHFKTTGQMMKPTDAYKATYADKFQKLNDDNRAAEIEAAKQAGIAEGRQAAQQENGGRGMPIAGRQGVGMGAVMRRHVARTQKSGDGTPIEAPLGKGVIAARAADEYMKKGDGAVQ